MRYTHPQVLTMTDNDRADADEESDRPTIELTPEHEQEEYEPPSEEKVLAWYEDTADHYDEKTTQAAQAHLEALKSDDVEKAPSTAADRSPYEKADDALLHAIERSSWWVRTQYDRDTDLQKTPDIWWHDDFVPEYVRSALRQVINKSSWDWMELEILNQTNVEELVAIFERHLLQHGGWTISELAKDLQTTYNLEEGPAVEMAADACLGVLNITKEEAYKDLEGSDEFRYKWVEPGHCTASVYKGIKEAVEIRGGAVTMSTLRSILMREARQYEGAAEGEGTPQYVAEWMPYRGSRGTFVRQY